MNQLKTITLLLIFTSGLLSLKLKDVKWVEFKYPKRNNTIITLNTDNFNSFSKEWRGSDYYYYGISTDSIICSVLYYKLNKEEQKLMVDPFGGMASPGIPFIYFSDNSNLKKYETNNNNWGKMTDDFMFRQNDIEEFEGIKIKQKHMYVYTMFDKDLFVNIHLSKTNYTAKDSTTMRYILSALTIKK
jgi:hypothetical protein